MSAALSLLLLLTGPALLRLFTSPLLVPKTCTSRFELAVAMEGLLVLLLCVSFSRIVFCQEEYQEEYLGRRQRSFESKKIEILCFNRGCMSECGFSKTFCLDERLSKTSPSYILNNQVVFLRAQLVLETNVSAVGLIQESFPLPASLFTSQIVDFDPDKERSFTSFRTSPETFSELKAMDSSLSGLNLGDPYCVWQKRDFSWAANLDSCYFNTWNDTPLGVPVQASPTGQFGTSCSVKRFG